MTIINGNNFSFHVIVKNDLSLFSIKSLHATWRGEIVQDFFGKAQNKYTFLGICHLFRAFFFFSPTYVGLGFVHLSEWPTPVKLRI